MILRIILAFAAIYLIWGSTYLAIRVAVETMPPFVMAGVRFVISGLLMALFVPRSAWRGMERRHWRAAAISGALFFCGGNGLVSWAEQNIDSGIAALVIATIPGWMIVWQRVMEKRRPRRRSVLGAILGFAGVGVLMVRPSSDVEIAVSSVIVLVCAAGLWGMGSVYVRRAPLPDNKTAAVAMQFFLGGLVLLAAATITGEWGRLDVPNIDTAGWVSVVYLVIFGSLVAFTAYQFLLRHVEPARAGTYAFVNPAIAVFLGWAIGGEEIYANVIVAGMIIVVGVILIMPFRLRFGPFASLKGELRADRD